MQYLWHFMHIFIILLYTSLFVFHSFFFLYYFVWMLACLPTLISALHPLDESFPILLCLHSATHLRKRFIRVGMGNSDPCRQDG